MYSKPGRFLENHRVKEGRLASDSSAGNNGAFLIPSPYESTTLQLVCSDGDGWDHVSVSVADRCPTWDEMCYVKGLLFRPSEWVLQYHPALVDHIDRHPYCLHLWRPQTVELPKPPKCMDWLKKNYPHRTIPRSSCLGCPFKSNEQWRKLKARPDDWEDVCQLDEAIRHSDGMRGMCFLHRSCVPLREAPLDGDQMNYLEDDCLGLCGT